MALKRVRNPACSLVHVSSPKHISSAHNSTPKIRQNNIVQQYILVHGKYEVIIYFVFIVYIQAASSLFSMIYSCFIGTKIN